MHMQSFTATEAKQKFGELLDESQRQPVEINKQGRPFAVILSAHAFEILEDAYWAMRAEQDAKSGFLGPEESEKFLNDLRKRNLEIVKNRR